MRRFATIASFVALAAGAPAMGGAADAADDGSLFRVLQGGRWGYIDRRGNVVIPPRFGRAEPFSEGLAAVELDGKLGYVDRSGALVLVPSFAPAGALHRPFVAGRAAVRQGSKLGYVDRTGKLVIQARFLRADDFSDGVALVCDDQDCAYIDPVGRGVVLVGPMGGAAVRDGVGTQVLAMAMGRERVRLVDVRAGRIAPAEYDGVGVASEGLVPVRVGRSWGYVDRDGRGVIAPAWEWAGPFAGGLAPVRDADGRCGYVDRSGRLAVAARFRTCGAFSGGLARVDLATSDGEAERVAFVDRTGRVAIEGAKLDPPFDSAEDFEGGLAAVGVGGEPRLAGRGTRIGYVDPSGRYVWKPTE